MAASILLRAPLEEREAASWTSLVFPRAAPDARVSCYPVFPGSSFLHPALGETLTPLHGQLLVFLSTLTSPHQPCAFDHRANPGFVILSTSLPHVFVITQTISLAMCQ